MSFLTRGLGNLLRPFVQPAAVQCLNIVRNFANYRHKKIIKLAKGTKLFLKIDDNEHPSKFKFSVVS
jgi:hypothetical protein